MRPFEYIQPGSAEDAVAALADAGGGARLLAGGTDLLVDLKHAANTPEVLVDVSRVPEFNGIEMTGEGLRIGSMVTHTEIMQSPLIAEHAPAMIDAAHTVGAVQTRNLGTLGGNLVTCVPSMDSGPVLLALDAEIDITGPDGGRRVTLAEFFVAPRQTSLGAGEIMAAIVIPEASLGKPAHFLKFGLRKGQALALVNVAAGFWIEDGKISAPRIALGAVAPVVIRAPKAEEILAGAAPGEDLFTEAGRIAAAEARPIDDFRASAGYRRQLISVLTRRALSGALAAAGQGDAR